MIFALTEGCNLGRSSDTLCPFFIGLTIMALISVNFATDAATFNSRSHARTDYDVDITLLTRYKAAESADVEVGIARKTRAPDLVERYLWGQIAANGGIGDGRTYFCNLDLRPEVSYQVNLGIDLHGDTWRVRPVQSPFHL